MGSIPGPGTSACHRHGKEKKARRKGRKEEGGREAGRREKGEEGKKEGKKGADILFLYFFNFFN